MTKIDIIKETVEFYSADPTRRSLNNLGECVFNGKNATHCAVGRYMLPKYKEMGFSLPANDCPLENLVEENNVKDLDAMLEEKYRGHDTKFWRDLQWLHDNEAFWLGFRLKTNGDREVNDLIEKYKDK